MKYSKITSQVITALALLVAMGASAADKATKTMDYTGKLSVVRTSPVCTIEITPGNTSGESIFSVKAWKSTGDGFTNRTGAPLSLTATVKGGNACYPENISFRVGNSGTLIGSGASSSYELLPLSTTGLAGSGPAYVRAVPYLASVSSVNSEGQTIARGSAFYDGVDGGTYNSWVRKQTGLVGGLLSSAAVYTATESFFAGQYSEAGSGSGQRLKDKSLVVARAGDSKMIAAATINLGLGVSKGLYDSSDVALTDYSVVKPGLKVSKSFTLTVNPI